MCVVSVCICGCVCVCVCVHVHVCCLCHMAGEGFQLPHTLTCETCIVQPAEEAELGPNLKSWWLLAK